MFRYFFVFLLFPFILSGEDSVELNFYSIKEWNEALGKNIEITGFMSETEGGMQILSAEPNLKTCCVGSKEKREHQILLTKKLKNIRSGYAVTIRGVLSKVKNTEERTPLFRIEKAIVVEKMSSYALLKLGLTLVFAVIAILFMRPRDCKRRSSGR